MDTAKTLSQILRGSEEFLLNSMALYIVFRVNMRLSRFNFRKQCNDKISISPYKIKSYLSLCTHLIRNARGQLSKTSLA